MTLDRRARGAWLAAVLGVLAVLGGVVVTNRPGCVEHCQVVSAAIQQPAPSPTEPPDLEVNPTPGADDVDPLTRVMVTAQTGTLSGVAMVNDSGKTVPGVMTPDNKAWKPTGQLGYGRTYTMTIAGRGPRRHADPADLQLHHADAEQPDPGVLQHHRRQPAAGRRHLRGGHGDRRPLRRADHQQGQRRAAT